ncbi:hypothetical protein [Methanosarcina horonobensis]|uniref:hypothetical protein n=1 Tax=Methanosarcina horonobensis TaxID=418008 RepID=UPI0022B8EF39|nr:hypothetical protein [Methanosarcina horonobensis]
MSGQTNMSALTGRFIGSGSPCLAMEPTNQNGIERAKTSKKNPGGDLLDDSPIFTLVVSWMA